jgi:hypothetical protein
MESASEKLIILPVSHVLVMTRQCRFFFGPNDQICLLDGTGKRTCQESTYMNENPTEKTFNQVTLKV